jgi:hypothetical protein
LLQTMLLWPGTHRPLPGPQKGIRAAIARRPPGRARNRYVHRRPPGSAAFPPKHTAVLMLTRL